MKKKLKHIFIHFAIPISEFKCNNPGAVANAQLHENANSVDGGAFVKYTCNSNFALKSGNLQRACVGEDSLTGQPPLCTRKFCYC